MIKKLIIGFIAGIISGLFASGGGLILVPAFVYMLNLKETEARATALYVIFPLVIVSSFFYNNGNFINWELCLKCALGGIIGGYCGSKLLKRLSINILKISFIIFIIYTAARMIF